MQRTVLLQRGQLLSSRSISWRILIRGITVLLTISISWIPFAHSAQQEGAAPLSQDQTIDDIVQLLSGGTGGPEIQILFQALAVRKSEALPVIRRELRSGDLWKKLYLTKFLQFCAWPELRADLTALAKDPNEHWLPRQGALYALGEIGDIAAGPEILTILSEPNCPQGVQLVAISALARIGYQDASPAIDQFTTHQNIHLRLFANRALAQFGKPVDHQFLVGSLNDQDYIVRQDACGALAETDGVDVEALLRSVAERDANESVRSAAQIGLLDRQIRNQSVSQKLEFLKGALGKAERRTAIWILRTITKKCGPAGREYIRSISRSNDGMGERARSFITAEDGVLLSALQAGADVSSSEIGIQHTSTPTHEDLMGSSINKAAELQPQLYIGPDATERTDMRTGAREEDNPITRTFHHGFNPLTKTQWLLPIIGPAPGCNPAREEAFTRWNEMVSLFENSDLYDDGDSIGAWHFLGRASHLLQDMSSPLHVLGLPHGLPLAGIDWGPCKFEEYWAGEILDDPIAPLPNLSEILNGIADGPLHSNDGLPDEALEKLDEFSQGRLQFRYLTDCLYKDDDDIRGWMEVLAWISYFRATYWGQISFGTGSGSGSASSLYTTPTSFSDDYVPSTRNALHAMFDGDIKWVNSFLDNYFEIKDKEEHTFVFMNAFQNDDWWACGKTWTDGEQDSSIRIGGSDYDGPEALITGRFLFDTRELGMTDEGNSNRRCYPDNYPSAADNDPAVDSMTDDLHHYYGEFGFPLTVRYNAGLLKLANRQVTFKTNSGTANIVIGRADNFGSGASFYANTSGVIRHFVAKSEVTLIAEGQNSDEWTFSHWLRNGIIDPDYSGPDITINQEVDWIPEEGETWTAVYANPAFPAPTALAATNITNSGFTANWMSVGGAIGYRLDVSTSSSFTSFVGIYNDLDVGNTTTFEVTGLSSGTTYYYRIRAYDSSDTSIDSNTITVPIGSPVDAPVATAATDITVSGLTANWTAVGEATGYRLDVSTDSLFTSFVGVYNNLDVGNSTSRAVSGLSGGVFYYYRVRAYNEGGTSLDSNTITAMTRIGGTMRGNVLWTAANGPYVVESSLTIQPQYVGGVYYNSTLTIEAGAIVKFSPNTYIQETTGANTGTIIVQGTPAFPVYFTSLKDDTIGGDTNGDGSATTPAPGDWAYVRILNSSTNIHNCVFRYGGYYSTTTYGALYISGSSPTVANNMFSHNRRGIYINDGSPSLSGNTIQNSTYVPIILSNSSYPTYSGNVYTDNGQEGIGLTGTVALNGTWYKESIPYVVYTGVTVSAASTVTIPAGTIFKFSDSDYLYAQGVLNLQATSGDPVYFTSFKDDTVGGDTNNDGVATSPAVGDWAYVRIANTNNNIHDCVFRYGGYYSTSNYGALYITGSSPTVADNMFSHNRRGIYINDGSPSLSGNTIQNSTYAPLCLAGSSFPSYSDNSYLNNGRQGIQLSGTVGLNGTWYKESIPYVILDSVTISAAYTVTVPAGTIFKFDASDFLYAQGVLNLQATSGDPVYFTSLRDDTVGGDTNNDGVATSPASGDWAYVRIANTNNNIHDCVFRYGGYYSATNYGVLYITDSSPTVTSNRFYRNRRGITAQNSSPALTNNRIEASTYYPVFVYHSSFPTYSGNTYLNNGIQALCLSGSVAANGTWHKDTIPYYVEGSLTIGAAYTVNVPAGTIFKFGASDYLYVQGILNLQSTAANPVYFTSLKDDTIGGDTNGDFGATTPAMGDWGYVRIGNSSNNIHNCIFRYGGIVSSSYYGALYVYGCSPTVSSNQFRVNRYGLQVYNGSPTIQGNVFSQNYTGLYVNSGSPVSHDCDFEDNTNYGVYNLTTTIINAENCWWDAATGPNHSSNPDGTGDRVSDYVDFIPFDGEKNFNSVSGRVRSRNFPWEGILGVQVSADTGQMAITDENGNYSLASVPAGERTITASHVNLDYYATGTSDTASQTVDVSEGVENINFDDFACRGVALATIEADTSSPEAGDTVNITVSMMNSGASLTSVISYLDISFSDTDVTIGSATGTGWSAIDSWPVGSTIYHWDGAGTRTTMTSVEHLITGRIDGGFGSSATYSFTFPITIGADVDPGTVITLKFRGTIGDSRNPLSGPQDQQGLFVKTFDLTVSGGEGIRKDDLVGTWDGQGVYYRDSDTGAWIKMASPATMITVGDIDGDGIDDLIGLWPAQGGIWVKYSQSGAWARLSSTAQYISAGDMNGDSRVDLIGTWDSQGVYYRDSMTGVWVKMASPATMVTAGDIDGDGTDDLIGLWPSQGGIWIKYSLTGTWARLSSTAQYIAVGDMNGDGRDDLIGTWDGQGVYYRDSMTGAWVKMASPATMVTAGDIDGDGTDDLMGLWPSQGGIWVKYSSDGTWERLSSTARYIVAGKMRAGEGAGVLAQKPETAELTVEELANPMGGSALGPEQALGAVDLLEMSPGGSLFVCVEDINLVPEEIVSEKTLRIPGPGEPDFKWIDQKDQFPVQTKPDRSKIKIRK